MVWIYALLASLVNFGLGYYAGWKACHKLMEHVLRNALQALFNEQKKEVEKFFNERQTRVD
jgi:hypothetical protein